MRYLENYNLTKEEIKDLKETYNDGIINFISENEIFVTDTIEYLKSEGIDCIYFLMKNNIKIFLETKVSLKNKIEEYKQKGFSTKAIIMLLSEIE